MRSEPRAARGVPRAASALVGLALLSCHGWTDLDDVACPPEGTELRYGDFSGAFFGAWCNRCHAADAEDRSGAPEAYVFDSYEQVLALRKRIFARAAGDNVSMPPGPDDPPAELRDALAIWIACGSPR
jgi:hypothetical protein